MKVKTSSPEPARLGLESVEDFFDGAGSVENNCSMQFCRKSQKGRIINEETRQKATKVFKLKDVTPPPQINPSLTTPFTEKERLEIWHECPP